MVIRVFFRESEKRERRKKIGQISRIKKFFCTEGYDGYEMKQVQGQKKTHDANRQRPDGRLQVYVHRILSQGPTSNYFTQVCLFPKNKRPSLEIKETEKKRQRKSLQLKRRLLAKTERKKDRIVHTRGCGIQCMGEVYIHLTPA